MRFVRIVLLIIWSQPTWSTPSALECINWKQTHPNWLWCDDFEEDRILEDNYFEVDRANGHFKVVDNVAYSGTGSLKSTYTPNQSEHGNLKISIGKTPMPNGIAPNKKFDDIYWRFYLMTGPNWKGNGHKLSRAVVYSKPWIPALFGHVWEDNHLGIAIDPATTIEGKTVTGRRYNDWDKLNWMQAKDYAETQIFSPANRERWFCIEVRLKLNSLGNSDGLFSLWIDEKLEANLEGLNLRGSYDEFGINAIHLENYKAGGSDAEQSRFFDNLVISTTRIGCYGPPITE